MIIEARIRRWALLAWSLLTVWLLACAFVLQGEYGDGYQTIANARYFFGDNSDFYVQRGPLAAIILWPAQLVVSLFDIDPIDVRPYHVLSAILHSAYLFMCWLLLSYTSASLTARLLAFAAAILSSVFYAYAPYLSHDIFPGLLFLLQIFLCDRWIRRPSTRDAIYLIVLGAAVTLIKQTYAIFWIAILVYALLAFTFKWEKDRLDFRKLIRLAAFGVASATLSWVSYAWFIGGDIPEAPFLNRPIYLIKAIFSQYDNDLSRLATPDLSTLFARDLYLRNLFNYGTAAALLVIPGLIIAMRGIDPRQRQVAVCWLVCATALALVEFREVRYMAILAPLTAMLLAPMIEKLMKRRAVIAVLTLVVFFDQARGFTIAAEQLSSAARINVKRFINSAEGRGDVHASRVLSFVYDADSTFRRDRYQGIYHLTAESMLRLYGETISVETITNPGSLGLGKIKNGDRVYYSNNTMVRQPPWQENNLPNGFAEFLLVAGIVDEIELTPEPGGFVRKGNKRDYLMLVPDPSAGPQMPVIFTGSIGAEDAAQLLGHIDGSNSLQVKVVVIKALCQADQCMYR